MASTTKSVSLPTLSLPKLDIDGLFGLLKSNLSAAYEAQTIWVEATHAIAKAQHGYLEQAFAGAKTTFEGKGVTSSEDVFTDAKTATEKLVAVAKEIVDQTVSAQRRVAEIVTARGQANVATIQKLAA